MDLAGSFVISAFLLACAVGLVVWHVRAWEAARRAEMDAAEAQFHHRQFRRRIHIAVLWGLAAVLLPAGHWIMLRAAEAGRESAWTKAGVVVVGLLILLLGWMGLLALGDWWATKFFFGQLRDKCQLEQTKLRAQLRRLQGGQSNGQGNGSPRNHGPEKADSDPESKS